MLALILEVLPLALAAAISPVVLMVALAVLAGPRPVAESLAYAGGVTATTVALYGAGLLVIRAQQDGLEPGWLGSGPTRIVIDLVLIGAGAALLLVRPDPRRGERLQARLLDDGRGLPHLVGAGVFVMATNASTFVILIAILHVVAHAAVPPPEDLAALAVATVVTALPALVPLAAAVVGGERARARLGRLGAVIVRRGRYVMGALWIVFGLVGLGEQFGVV